MQGGKVPMEPGSLADELDFRCTADFRNTVDIGRSVDSRGDGQQDSEVAMESVSLADELNVPSAESRELKQESQHPTDGATSTSVADSTIMVERAASSEEQQRTVVESAVEEQAKQSEQNLPTVEDRLPSGDTEGAENLMSAEDQKLQQLVNAMKEEHSRKADQYERALAEAKRELLEIKVRLLLTPRQ
eukprot:SAG31_NODE_5669_length_2393_cov_1.883173_3_plen_189_part_00